MSDISALFPPDRLDQAAAAATVAGLDALLLTPGAELRYLTGYDALPLERLTCLVLPVAGDATLVVPQLERPRAEEAVRGAGVAIVDWPETANPNALVVSLTTKAL